MKPWNVSVDGQNYQIMAKGNSLVVDGEKSKLKELNSRKEGMFRVYELPLGQKKAYYYVNTWIGGATLVMDGVDCATGQLYSPPKMPGWAYVFMALHCLNFANGALGAMLAVAGIGATMSISCNTRMPLPVRIFLDLLLLIAMVVIIFSVAVILQSFR